MKKIIISIAIAFFVLLNINTTFADNTKNPVTVTVTEKIPGIDCKIKEGSKKGIDKNGNEVPVMYECKVEKGATQIIKMLGNIIKYFTYIASLAGVLFIVYNGIMYSMGGADQSLKDESKKRIIGTLIGIIVLLLSGPILQIIAPWIYK